MPKEQVMKATNEYILQTQGKNDRKPSDETAKYVEYVDKMRKEQLDYVEKIREEKMRKERSEYEDQMRRQEMLRQQIQAAQVKLQQKQKQQQDKQQQQEQKQDGKNTEGGMLDKKAATSSRRSTVTTEP